MLQISEPKAWVSVKHPENDDEFGDELYYEPKSEDADDILPELPRSGLSHRMLLFSLVILLSVVLITMVLFCMALLYRKQKKKYLYSTGRSVMTFSNPNYYTTTNESAPISVANPNDKKPFIWKRLKYDKSQVKAHKFFYFS